MLIRSDDKMKKLILMLIIMAIIITACAPKNVYQTEGKVEILNYDDKYITINQTIPIPDVMPAMVMSYDINDNNLNQIKNLKEGDDVSITLKSDERKLNFELIKIIKK